MSGSKAPDFDTYGLLRATHSHNPTQYSHIVGLSSHFYAHIGLDLLTLASLYNILSNKRDRLHESTQKCNESTLMDQGCRASCYEIDFVLKNRFTVNKLYSIIECRLKIVRASGTTKVVHVRDPQKRKGNYTK